jgi:hypothetical protein
MSGIVAFGVTHGCVYVFGSVIVICTSSVP